MKRVILVKIAEFLKQKKRIFSIQRVDDTIIEMEFEDKDRLFFDMKKSQAYIFKKDSYNKTKSYTAPFDIALKKRVQNSYIKDVEVLEGNRILKFTLLQKGGYKADTYYLYFEFTGKNTNVIITDFNDTIIEALRHIDSDISYRVIKTGVKLIPLPAIDIKESEIKIDNLEEFLYSEFEKRDELRLKNAKKQKIALVEKKIKKLKSIKNSFQSKEFLLKEASRLKLQASLLLANIYKINDYEKSVEIEDFEGRVVKFDLPSEARSVSEAANILFAKAKRLTKKAENIHIELESIEAKIEFYEKLKSLIDKAKSIDEVLVLLPKQHRKIKSKNSSSEYESFFYEGYKIMVGKSEKGNIKLLKEAKKGDIWLHLKDIASTHVIIRCDKVNLPKRVIEFAAKLCVNFSSVKSGAYLVDYTKRRDVKVKEGAFVNYVNYKTLKVVKE
jgi:predicted ribosome quality control (RQC) complex YloA/Tae2 family protein